jgi:hypothetical protein
MMPPTLAMSEDPGEWQSIWLLLFPVSRRRSALEFLSIAIGSGLNLGHHMTLDVALESR